MPTTATRPCARWSKTSRDRRHVHQHVALRAAFGKERRMDQTGLAAELFGHQRRDMVDVGVVLALDAARQWHDFDVEPALRQQAPTTALTALPPVMR